MKALTLTQPWATLVAIGAKKIETRSWPTHYRGPLAVHAAKGFPKWASDLVRNDWTFFGALEPHLAAHYKAAGLRLVPCEIGRRTAGSLPLGAVLATCTLVDCEPIRGVEPVSESERAFGDYSEGRYAWMLVNVVQLQPIPAKGALGFWEWEMPEALRVSGGTK